MEKNARKHEGQVSFFLFFSLFASLLRFVVCVIVVPVIVIFSFNHVKCTNTHTTLDTLYNR